MMMTLITGIVLFFGATCLGLHEILLAPDRPNYPTASRRVRWAMTVWMVTLYYRAVEITVGAFAPEPVYVPLGVTAVTLAVAVVQALLLEQVLRQWLPARLHARIRHLLNVASCGRSEAIRRARAQSNTGLWPGVEPASIRSGLVGPALAELTLDGGMVWGPNEGPGAPDGIAK